MHNILLLWTNPNGLKLRNQPDAVQSVPDFSNPLTCRDYLFTTRKLQPGPYVLLTWLFHSPRPLWSSDAILREELQYVFPTRKLQSGIRDCCITWNFSCVGTNRPGPKISFYFKRFGYRREYFTQGPKGHISPALLGELARRSHSYRPCSHRVDFCAVLSVQPQMLPRVVSWTN